MQNTPPKTGLPRRRLLSGLAAMGTLGALVPAWARQMNVAGQGIHDAPQTRTFNLDVNKQHIDIAGGKGHVVSIGNSVPGPLLEWYEGDEVVLNVRNLMDQDTSIHWHGILLPFEMDGVPGVTFQGIKPGTTFQYRFPIKQSGTYWYHSHSGLQEQSGAYGPLIVHPRGGEPVRTERDYVVVLSDYTFADPHSVMRKLKKMSDYYNFAQFTAANGYGYDESQEAWATKFAWDRMRMMPTDISDVTGYAYTYLMNGLHPAGNWTGLFKPGERVRLRIINAAAMTFFNVRIPGLPMTVVNADGQNVEPVETDELQIGVAETYDVIVEPQAEPAYTIMAESIDRSGFAAGTLATQAGLSAPIPTLRRRPLLTMADMGMDHDAHMGHGKMDHGAQMDHSKHKAQMDHSSHGAHKGQMDHSSHDAHKGHAMATEPAQHHNHGAHSAMPTRLTKHSAKRPTTEPGPIIARHNEDTHGPGNLGVATVQRNRLSDAPTGLAEVDHRVLVYSDLRRLDKDFDPRPPGRELELHLTGHMERYMWSFDGDKFWDVQGPIEFEHHERLRLTLVNDTMMNHPIHLHGMWMELENGHGEHIPRKHTINVMPASRVSAIINADAPGRWAFHCHLLFHMDMGMFRVVRVS
ncbi:MAG: copper resistance system multicopper oxidase [Pseudomonadales bacterium]